MMDEPTPVDLARVAAELNLKVEQVENVVALFDEGNTVPFITRYRKERTGNLDEEQLRAIQQRVQTLRQLAERAQTILRLIDAQGKLTPELRAAIEQAETMKRLEDLYVPYRPKRRSRATAARERGLEPLAEMIWNGTSGDLQEMAEPFRGPDVRDVDAALQGAADILAERISEDADVRELARGVARRTGRLEVSASKKAGSSADAYRDYFDYQESITRIPPHRALAINRGEKADALKVRFTWEEAEARAKVALQLRISANPHQETLKACVADALSRLIHPSLERELRRELTEQAGAHAVTVFATNLRNLLLQPPLKGKRVLAIDPGFRTGCKLAALDELGQCTAIDVTYVTGSAEKRAAAKEKLAGLLKEHQCELVAIGNGTACRETEELVSETIAEHVPDVRYVIVNEAGASIYSASTVARDEFPDLDATARGTISIGRRLQDPLSELVKIDPQHIGVGMYQHDVSAKQLQESLDQVIESCVNYVGVDLNTSSSSLLRHVSGFNQLIARRVVEWREKHGRFERREQLLDVSGVGEATYTQAAGFLKINDGVNPLDGTWIHPESYDAAKKILDRLDVSLEDLRGGAAQKSNDWVPRAAEEAKAIAEELQIGVPTCRDILDALARPGRDPRGDLEGPVFKQGILTLDDLAEGMELTGTVLNVVDFGAFVDIGLKDSGLVHISQMADRFISSPHDVVAVGAVVTVWVLGIDAERRRVSLTMLNPDGRQPKKPSGSRRAGRQETPAAAKSQGKPAGDKKEGRSFPASSPKALPRCRGSIS